LGAKTQTSHREQGGVDEKVPTWSWAKCWRNNYILELVKSRALLGELQLQQRKEQPGEIIKNYYPAVLDEATWRWRICSRRWKAARSRRWNQRRGVWQHPCGRFDPLGSHPTDSRAKYRCYFPADVLPA
jgi:hypothetical protein